MLLPFLGFRPLASAFCRIALHVQASPSLHPLLLHAFLRQFPRISRLQHCPRSCGLHSVAASHPRPRRPLQGRAKCQPRARPARGLPRGDARTRLTAHRTPHTRHPTQCNARNAAARNLACCLCALLRVLAPHVAWLLLRRCSACWRSARPSQASRAASPTASRCCPPALLRLTFSSCTRPLMLLSGIGDADDVSDVLLLLIQVGRRFFVNSLSRPRSLSLCLLRRKKATRKKRTVRGTVTKGSSHLKCGTSTTSWRQPCARIPAPRALPSPVLATIRHPSCSWMKSLWIDACDKDRHIHCRGSQCRSLWPMCVLASNTFRFLRRPLLCLRLRRPREAAL